MRRRSQHRHGHRGECKAVAERQKLTSLPSNRRRPSSAGLLPLFPIARLHQSKCEGW